MIQWDKWGSQGVKTLAAQMLATTHSGADASPSEWVLLFVPFTPTSSEREGR